jgi:hypothetical protein
MNILDEQIYIFLIFVCCVLLTKGQSRVEPKMIIIETLWKGMNQSNYDNDSFD